MELLLNVLIVILLMSLNMVALPKAKSVTPVIILNVFAAPSSLTTVIRDDRVESNIKL